MSLTGGSRLGPYEIVSPLGAGGMGEVYRARDARLGREVAIKVLPADKLSDPARRARFVQEARAASALNHPHIVTIYEIESAEGVDFIVMELVPGKTLDALIPRTGMRLGEALPIAIQLADALAKAHAAGIVHRDLKPGNVMVTPDGVVKVLDFGLAKLVPGDTVDSDERTMTADAAARPVTRPGTIAGTTAYMSPEQARGEGVDARTDIFAFGAVLYEMVTGRRAFGGASSAETLAAVLKEQPKPPSELVPEVPKELERIVLRCLRKERERRFQNMLDVKVELQEVKEESDSQAEAPAGEAAVRRRRRQRWVAGVVAGVLILAAAAAVWRWRQGQAEPPPTVVQLTWTGRDGEATFSPDGEQIAYASRGGKGDEPGLRLKFVGEAEARRLATDGAGGSSPSWSPDGKQIAFVRYGVSSPETVTIYLVSALGGPERRLVDFPTPLHLSTGYQLSWSRDGRWLAAARARAAGETTPESGGIHLVPAGGGEPRPLTLPEKPVEDVCPAFSPDGRALAYAACKGGPEGGMANCGIEIVSLDTDFRPAAAPRRLPGPNRWVQGLAWTRDGRSIVFGVNEIPNTYLWRVWADGSAPPERIDLAGRGAVYPSAAKGRDRLAFVRNVWDVDVYRLEIGSSPAPLVASTFDEFYARYSPDGRRIAFQSGRSGDAAEIWLTDADGSNPTRLTRGPGRYQGSPRWSPDGRSIVFSSRDEDARWHVWTIGVDGSGLRQVTRDDLGYEQIPSWSQDGRWIYFSSDRSGRAEVFRLPAAGGPEEQVTRGGGSTALESLDGRTLYYTVSSRKPVLLARPTAGGKEREIAPCIVTAWNYAVAPQGVFYVGCRAAGATSGSTRTVLLWESATGRTRPVATIEGDWIAGLSASPDGRTLLWGRSMYTFSTDLMMIENFR